MRPLPADRRLHNMNTIGLFACRRSRSFAVRFNAPIGAGSKRRQPLLRAATEMGACLSRLNFAAAPGSLEEIKKEARLAEC